jgi:outer membrane protein assembly factor BamB
VSASLTLDLKVEGDPAVGGTGKIAGSYELDMNGTPYKSGKGAVTGTLESKSAAGDALSLTGAWPSFWGPTLDMASQPQPRLVEDFAQARPVWRSEAYVLTGYGNAPDSRYFTRALGSGNGGGGSSPVIADGTVYMYFYLPSPQSEPALKGNPFWERTYTSEDDFKAKMAAAKANDREVGWVLNHFRPLADDVVVAMDAATGATKWMTVLPLRSPNLQTHKHRGVSGVPMVAGDTIYVANLASRLYALDRATGKLKWEMPDGFDPAKVPVGKTGGPAYPSPMLLADTLIWGRSGLDPATGKEKWKGPDGHQSYLLRWTKDGKDRLLVIQGYEKRVFCLDPATGKELWKQDVALVAGAPLSAVISGDILLAAPAGEKGALPQYAGWQLSENGLTQVWKDQPLQPDENIPVTVADGKAYLLGAHFIRILDIATGQQVSEWKHAEMGPGSNPWLGVVGDRLLLIPEGQHGGVSYVFLDRALKNLGPLWRPNHTTTTAYNSQPVIAPVVDGRIFMRGGDGIYCYDLRAAP